MQRARAFEGVEGEDAVHPSGTGQSLGLVGEELHAARDDEHVVREHGAIGQPDLVPLERHRFDVGFMEDDAGLQLLLAGSDDVLGLGQAEGNEEQSGLVDVPIVVVDDADEGVLGSEHAAESVCDQRPAGAGAEDHDSVGHGCAHSSGFREEFRRLGTTQPGFRRRSQSRKSRVRDVGHLCPIPTTVEAGRLRRSLREVSS